MLSMDVNFSCGKSASLDVDVLHDNSSSSQPYASALLDGGSVNGLESDLSRVLHIQDAQETHASDVDDLTASEKGSEERKRHQTEPDNNEPELGLQLLFSEPTPSKLVSAMKGSREKLGLSLTKLTVTWAPDVYDPVPNSVSHSKGRKQLKSRKNNDNNKRNGRKGQKGNFSRGGGGGGKDKKQLRKIAGNTNRGCKSLNAYDRLVNLSDGVDDFDVGSSDYCGSSFLKTSVTTLHYSVAEAL